MDEEYERDRLELEQIEREIAEIEATGALIENVPIGIWSSEALRLTRLQVRLCKLLVRLTKKAR